MEKEGGLNMEPEKVVHPFAPVFDEDSRVLILGSLPSVKSREQQFYYGHPQNRFWKMLSACLDGPVLESVEQKEKFLHEHHIALWDVIHSCTIAGSSDASIRDVCANDLNDILGHSQVNMIICNGKAAEKYYRKFQLKQTGIEPVVLPSTSPANAAWSLSRLVEAWKPVLMEGLGKQEVEV